MFDLIGGRASWTALGLPTEGTVGDRGRIGHAVEAATTVSADAFVSDLPEGEGPVAVIADHGVLLGSLDAATGRRLPADTPVVRAMVPAPGTIRPELRIDEVAKRLADDGLDHVFVTTVSGLLLGIVVTERLHV